MKTTILCAGITLGALMSFQANAQSASQITIVSEPSMWYTETPMGFAPSAEAIISNPDITTLPGPIPEHWNVTRLDPWTYAKVIRTHNGASVVTWGSSRILPNWHEYRTPFYDMARGKNYYTKQDLPAGHALLSEFHFADTNRDGKITKQEHRAFFGVE